MMEKVPLYKPIIVGQGSIKGFGSFFGITIRKKKIEIFLLLSTKIISGISHPKRYKYFYNLKKKKILF